MSQRISGHNFGGKAPSIFDKAVQLCMQPKKNLNQNNLTTILWLLLLQCKLMGQGVWATCASRDVVLIEIKEFCYYGKLALKLGALPLGTWSLPHGLILTTGYRISGETLFIHTCFSIRHKAKEGRCIGVKFTGNSHL